MVSDELNAQLMTWYLMTWAPDELISDDLKPFKGTSRGLHGVFLPLVINPLMTHLYGKNRSGCSVMLLDH